MVGDYAHPTRLSRDDLAAHKAACREGEVGEYAHPTRLRVLRVRVVKARAYFASPSLAYNTRLIRGDEA